MDRSSLALAGFVAALLAGSTAAAIAAGSPSPSGGSPRGAPPPPHPQRIVSTNLPADEILLALVSPDRIVALSHFADDPVVSNVRRRARAVPHRVGGRAEPILALHPDVVFAFPFGQADAEALLRQANVPVVHVPGADSLDEIRAHVRRIGRVVGAPERAEALVAEMDRSLDAARERVRGTRAPRALLWNVTGTTAGAGTLFDELLAAAGGRNAAAEAGIRGLATLPLERALAIDPEVVLVIDYRADSRARQVGSRRSITDDPRWRSVTAVRRGRVHVLPPRHAYASSHHAAKAALDMGRLLHPQRFPETEGEEP
ncbi:MAG: ABC transporter substrate-binding protein [Myxococcota bacterium]